MSATNELFTRWKAHSRITTDAEAAKVLGISHGTPHHWRQGRNGAASVIERMAKDLGVDPIPTILQAFAEAARDAEDRKTLARLARRLGAACLALLAAAPLMMHSSPAAADEAQNAKAATLHPIHYAKFLMAFLRRKQPDLRRIVSAITKPSWCRNHLPEHQLCSPLALCQTYQ